ncbi:MotE family protein [Bacillus sp. 1NLA3E]|uniref:MotE family protein n=1 Tax=Bacillus sp. 1NLA3E TaxID=666686 RepID=UPI000247F31A|nr:hypothetical protein [Bacillus sp. 1NLA3E]AGK55365.1 hypothetical protein B1NLA3E_18105 [Bacillus sp. 1NLA3E]
MEEKKHGKLRTILFLMIPVLVIVILAIFLGIPGGETLQKWGNKIPVINRIIPDPAPNKTNTSDSQNDWQQKYLASSAEITDRDLQISKLTKQLRDTKTGLEDIKKNNQELQRQLETKQAKAVQNQMKQMAKMYANIPATKAAAMIASMPLEDAALTISNLKPDQQSSILGGMKDAKKAAQITLLVTEIAGLTEMDPILLKDQIHQIALQQENPTQILAETIAGMPSAQAAGIIQSMMVTNSQTAMELLRNINVNNRSQILTEIQKTNADLAAQIASSLNR